MPNEKRPVVKELKAPGRKAEEIYLATDPDREGEAIAWHLLASHETWNRSITQRVVFHEITEPAVADAFCPPAADQHGPGGRPAGPAGAGSPGGLQPEPAAVAQSAQPALGRAGCSRWLCGWSSIASVRSMLSTRWNTGRWRQSSRPRAVRTLTRPSWSRSMATDPVLDNEAEVKPYLVDMEEAAYADQQDQARRATQRNPSASFHHQHPPARSLAASWVTLPGAPWPWPSSFMKASISVRGAAVGLITYMRTDSTNVSELAQAEARQFISRALWRQISPGRSAQIQDESARRAGSP